MKTCKKLFSLLLVAVMLVAAIPTFAFAAAQNYELILKVDGTEVPGPRPTANFDKTTVATLDSNGELSTNAAADGFTVLNAFSVTGYSATGYNCTEVKFNDGAFKVRVELTTITCTHNWDYTDVGNDQQHLRRCTICNVKEMVDHNWVITNPEVAPTHTAEGSTAAKECSDCHKTIASTPIEKLKDHTFVNGVCACNAKEYKINYKLDGTDVSETYIDEAGNADMSSAKKVLTVLGKNADAYNTSDFNRDNVNISFTATTIPTNPAPASSYSKVVVVYCDENGNVKTNAGKNVILKTPYTGSTTNNDAQSILNHAGIGESVNNYASATVAVSGDTITVTLTDKADTRYVLNLTVVTGTTTTTKTYRAAYTGNVDTMSVLKGFGVDKDFNLDSYTYSTLGYDNAKTFTLTMTAKPTAADKYTVNCVVNGTQFASKTDVTYVGSFESNITNAQAILNAAGIQKTASEYKKVTITKSNTNVITVDLRNTVVVRVYNNANSYSEVTMDVGQPYVNYLGTNLINNSTFGGITVKDTSDRNTYYSASQVNGRTALVSAFDKEITIQRNGDSCTLYFLRSDGTVLESRKLYAGDQIGTLPSYIVGNVPATWTYNGKPISATDVYNFKTTSVNIVPYFGGISDVYVDVYTNGNVKTMQTRVKVTDLVQNGVLYLNSEVKSAISSALRNTSNKNLTYTAFFDASTWSDFIKTKNTNGAAEPIRVGDNSERQGSVYLYVMVNNVTQKATDSTNPKTGDDVKLGVAAAVLAVAVVGFGAAIVIKKKKGVQ